MSPLERDVELILRVIVGFLVGSLVGIERERAQLSRRSPAETPGFRSFGLTGLYGAIVGVLLVQGSASYGAPVINLALILATVFALVVGVNMLHRSFIARAGGIITHVVLATTFALGLLAGLGMVIESIAIAMIVTLVLAIKTPVERAVKVISYNELLAGFELGLVVFTLGPIVYALDLSIAGIDLKPIYVFFTVVLVISFTSYVLVKLKGPGSYRYLAFLGSLVNSEATLVNVLNLVRAVGDKAVIGRIVKDSIILVNTAMQLRSFFLTFATSLAFLGSTAALEVSAFVLAGVVPAFATLTWLTFSPSSVPAGLGDIKVEIGNPLNYRTAAKGAAVYFVLLLVSVLAKEVLAEYALVPIALFGGLVNASATILSILTVSSTYSSHMVAAAVLLTIGMATLNKPLYAGTAGAEKAEVSIIYRYSVLMALPPISASLLTMAAKTLGLTGF